MQAKQLRTAIEAEFAGSWCEVKSAGTSSLTVALPGEAPDVDEFFDLMREYGAAVDFKATPEGPIFEVYPDLTPSKPRGINCGVVVIFLLLLLSLAAAACHVYLLGN